MTSQPSHGAAEIRIERSYDASAEAVWELWSTPAGIESWWAPDGFTVKVHKLVLEPGGELVYAMMATAPEQIEFMRSAGMPLETVSQKVFTAIDPPTRIAYSSLVDFVPDVEPYWFPTVVEITPVDGQVEVGMSIEPMHDPVWTQRLVMGRENDLDNLAKVIAAWTDD